MCVLLLKVVDLKVVILLILVDVFGWGTLVQVKSFSVGSLVDLEDEACSSSLVGSACLSSLVRLLGVFVCFLVACGEIIVGMWVLSLVRMQVTAFVKSLVMYLVVSLKSSVM